MLTRQKYLQETKKQMHFSKTYWIIRGRFSSVSMKAGKVSRSDEIDINCIEEATSLEKKSYSR